MTFAVDKDPNAVLDYQFDWSAWLLTDQISTSTWTVDTGLTVTTSSHTATKSTVWFSGGTVKRRYKAVNRIVTAGGRTDDRTLVVTMVEK